MAKLLNKDYELSPFTFMGLMASEGKVPNTVSSSADKTFIMVALDDMLRETMSDLTAKGDFLSFMVENGLMQPEAPAPKYRFKITRPANLGGGFDGTFGGGALAH